MSVEDPRIANPLSNATANPWNAFFQDSELRDEIYKDVERTHQEKDLFTHDLIKEQTLNVLFMWCKTNPEISYKQGMNEILAPIIYICYAEAYLENDIPDLVVLNGPDYIETDSYLIFDKIMQLGMQDLFMPAITKAMQEKMRKNRLFEWNKNSTKVDGGDSAVIARINRCYIKILPILNNQLYVYLEQQGVSPHIFLQRYFRCLLTREFHLFDCLIIWDAIFAFYYKEIKINGFDEESELILLDFLCVSMIVFVKQFLFANDGSRCLQRLLKYPPVEDVTQLILMAKDFTDKANKQLSKPQAVIKSQEQAPFNPLQSSNEDFGFNPLQQNEIFQSQQQQTQIQTPSQSAYTPSPEQYKKLAEKQKEKEQLRLFTKPQNQRNKPTQQVSQISQQQKQSQQQQKLHLNLFEQQQNQQNISKSGNEIDKVIELLQQQINNQLMDMSKMQEAVQLLYQYKGKNAGENAVFDPLKLQ